METHKQYPKLIEKYVRTGAMDQPGADWLINIINPFPDYRSTPAGVPSIGSTASAVKTLQKTMTITKPVGLPAGQLWDAFVFASPVDSSPSTVIPFDDAFYCQYLATAQVTGMSPYSAHGSTAPLGVINAYTAPSGANPIPWSSSTYLQANKHSLTLADAWVGQGTYRLASFGYEIIDVTPALYRGGTMVSFRQEVNPYKTTALIEGTTGSVEMLSTTFYTGLPDTYAQCMRIPGSLQWGVEEGAYVVCTFDNHMEDFEMPVCNEGHVLGTSTLGVATGVNGVYVGRDSGTFPNNYAPTHLDFSGNYLKGLNESAVITITFHAVLEIIPNVTSVMIDFIKPSTSYNPELLQVYARAKDELPAASIKADNDAGDAFKTLLGIMAPALSMAFPAFASVIGAGAAGLSGVTTLIQNRRKKKLEAKTKDTKTPKGNINNTTNGKLAISPKKK